MALVKDYSDSHISTVLTESELVLLVLVQILVLVLGLGLVLQALPHLSQVADVPNSSAAGRRPSSYLQKAAINRLSGLSPSLHRQIRGRLHRLCECSAAGEGGAGRQEHFPSMWMPRT